MKISQLLGENHITLSCEIFPPKTGVALEKIDTVVQDIARLKPAFISVTYGAGGSTSKRTADIAAKIQKQYALPSLAHLTCVSSTREEIVQILSRFKADGIENILALRGDIPQDSNFPSPEHYHYASELIEDIRRQGDFCIGAACYPEGHIECAHKEDDIDYLKYKVDCGCDFLTTQMFFDNNVFYNFLYRALSKDIRVPIIPGVMPVINANQIRRSCELSGTVLPPRFKAITDKFSDDSNAMKQAGVAYATEQIIDLIANGIRHIHLYTMNRPDIAALIFNNLSDILK